jgi:Zn-dependent oligopeptidase
MFATVFEADPLSPEAGMRYRKRYVRFVCSKTLLIMRVCSILHPGGSRDEMDSLTEFLGRPPSNEAFMKKLLKGAEQSA